MKIKVKKEMNLPELIQWAWKNPELTTGKRFCTENKDNENLFIFLGRMEESVLLVIL